MKNFEITVFDPVGIHARPAGVLVKEAQKLSSDITVTCRGKSADAKKLLAVMSLGAKCGDTLSVSVEGENEINDAEKIKSVMEQL
ncbi:MAG: HPr family phosphocarrier protein [Ruminococcaceae bacterium]|nr:HPr family phosphocarrier protein [Oscillospiraceae bacterium]